MTPSSLRLWGPQFFQEMLLKLRTKMRTAYHLLLHPLWNRAVLSHLPVLSLHQMPSVVTTNRSSLPRGLQRTRVYILSTPLP